MERNVLLTIEYDGSNFSGWQRQPGKRTVQGVLEEGLSRFCNTKITINGTSRTDSGVHALGQRASFKGDFSIPLDRLKLALNNYFSGGLNSSEQLADVRIIECVQVDEDFHARFNAVAKTYRYLIHNSKNVDIFRRKYAYNVSDKLDISAMKSAAKKIVGTHDFKGFQSSGGNERLTTVRTVYSLKVFTDNDNVIVEITGDGFLYNMVRNIVGTLVEIGLGKRKIEDIDYILESLDRNNAGHKAPACGLYLVEVYYDKTKLG